MQEDPKHHFPAKTEPAFSLQAVRSTAPSCPSHAAPPASASQESAAQSGEKCLQLLGGAETAQPKQSHGPAVKELVLHKEKWRASSKLALLSALPQLIRRELGKGSG